ncbi:hypothetical protein [Mycobacterium sp. OTB74]|uniref:hypothetical protein n=1 Tax=Mycobacterium sp. OTB74 TaxID=1853452 RepID=UPI002476A33B|nr:hypothetical protein [Mycobacterium sp. OTB74]MDH6246666.1 hypothetical protein [Mycobacterium sp. OTB74]
MTTTAPQTASPDLTPSGSPNVYHLSGNGIHITYFPVGSGPISTNGLIKLIYQDSHQTKTFHATEVAVAEVANLGTLVTAVLHSTVDAGSTSVTVLVPFVVMEGAKSVPIETELITTTHFSPLTGIGRPQRDAYTVTKLCGTANVALLPV